MALNERLVFLKHFLKHFHHTGAITSSSRFLAKAATAHVRPTQDGPVKILEVGAGTGAFTCELVKLLRKDDQLVIYEINKEFAEILKKRFGHHRQVRIHCQPIQEIERKPAFDFIVAGVPLNNFPPALVKEILEILCQVAKPGATASLFEYAGVRKLKAPFVGKSERERLRQVAAVVTEFMRHHHLHSHFVPLNLPPAYARVMQF